MPWRKRTQRRAAPKQAAGDIHHPVIGGRPRRIPHAAAGSGGVGEAGGWPVDNYAAGWNGAGAANNPPSAQMYGSPVYLPGGVQRGFPAPMGAEEATNVPWRVRSGGAKTRWDKFGYPDYLDTATFGMAPHVGTPHNNPSGGHYYKYPAPILDLRLMRLVPYRVPRQQSAGVPYLDQVRASWGYQQIAPDPYHGT